LKKSANADKLLELGVCGKPKYKYKYNSDIKNGTKFEKSKNLNPHTDSFPTETACNPQFKLKMTKITLLAFNVQKKNFLNHDLNLV